MFLKRILFLSCAASIGVGSVYILNSTKSFLLLFGFLLCLVLIKLIVLELLSKEKDKAYAKIAVLSGFLIFGVLGIVRALFVTKSYLLYDGSFIGSDINVIMVTAFLWLLALIFFLLGNSVTVQYKWLDFIPIPNKNTPLNKIIFLCMLLFSIALWAHILRGGIFFSSLLRNEYGSAKEVNHILEMLEALMIPASLLAIYCFNKAKKRFIKVSMALIIIYSVIAMFCTGYRGNVLYIVGTGIVFSYLHRIQKQKITARFYVISAMVLTLAMVGMSVQFNFRKHGFDAMQIKIRKIGLPVLKRRDIPRRFKLLKRWESVDSYENSMLLIDAIPDHVNFLNGRSFYELIINPIPRKLWPEKPYGFGLFLAGLKSRIPVQGLAGSLVGESYANFGVLGVIVIFFLFGIGARAFHQIYIKKRDNDFIIMLYSGGLFFLCFLQIRGQILFVNSQFIYLMLIPIYVGLSMLGINSKEERIPYV